MSNLNKVMLIGRLTRDPEIVEFASGGKVANLGFAVNNRRRNGETGEWEEVPVWLNLKAFNRESGRKLADRAAVLTKGRQVYVEGHLALEEWTGKEDGKPHSRTLVYVDNMEFLGGGKPPQGEDKPRPEAEPEEKPARAGRPRKRAED
ncbi:MAG: single-stranded DNA-binding protein [Elusimicrobiota bacterium]